MLLDDRRIVLTLEAICWCTAAMVFFQQTDFPRAIAILPLLMAVLIRVEYPPPGRGVGAVAEAVPGLTFEEDHAKHAAGLFDKDGGLLRGHAYVLTFLRRTPASLKQMPRMARLSSGCEKVRATLHFVAVFAGDDDAGGPQAAAKKGQRKEGRQALTKEAAGKDATPGVLMATDTTGAAWDRYMRKHSCWALPHVFVVDRTGTILWHGQSNRRGLVPSLKTIVRQVVPNPNPDPNPDPDPNPNPNPDLAAHDILDKGYEWEAKE